MIPAEDATMEHRGHVVDRVIVLDDGSSLPEGTEVRVQPVKKPGKKPTKKSKTPLGQQLMRFAGIAKGLPTDLATNHDHYLHGRPRK
jgi:hypothetical protein